MADLSPSDALGDDFGELPDGEPPGGDSPSESGLDGVLSRSLDPEAPGPPIEEVQADYGLSRGPAMMARGLLRALGGGLPPIAEVGVGGVMTLAKRVDTSGQGQANTSGQGQSDGDGLESMRVGQ